MQWGSKESLANINQVSMTGKTHWKKKKWSFVWQSTYAAHLAIHNCHLSSSTKGTCWKGGAPSLVEDVVDWSVDHCDFPVTHDYAMFLEYSCFKNYNYSAQQAYGCILPFR